ncbi:MAG: TlpA disulfide reductase family protein [Candidatus Pedobacter colombiensis]|uniref:TlpA disulfide reductase family protein n=1 Tax=Candidatus Pedobacter colombiensis TaxID=3121371 RepID=A0AAJ6B7Z7_9SPHI|nr:TlpA disulfide reductase family protein [Pedobacter sp.]WEK21647.1 MAG: TlpA disulfide reductase family protein [Pedobacter sp.]
MKKTTLAIVMATLCLIFKAKSQENNAIDVTSKGIQIGQKMPDINISNLYNYKDANGKPITSLNLSDIKSKLIILDFWATWCAPCVAMIPKMETLQKQFEGEVQILQVTDQTKDEVLPFLKKIKKGASLLLPQVTGDKELAKLFPHVYLPHYVWIDYTGTVKAITGHEEITAENIDKVLDNATGKQGLKQKKDLKIAYDEKRPFLLNGNGGDGSKMIDYSVLSRSEAGIGGGYIYGEFEYNGIKGRRVTGWNQTIPKLYMIALAEGKTAYGFNRLVLDVKDSTELFFKGTKTEYKFSNWRSENEYCYELISARRNDQTFYKRMQDDLDRYFSRYNIKLERRKTMCLALVTTVDHPDLLSKGGKPEFKIGNNYCSLQNMSLDVLLARLNLIYLQSSRYPVVNDTGIKGNVDISFEVNLSDVHSINNALAPFNLKLIEKEVVTEMIVVRDNEKVKI